MKRMNKDFDYSVKLKASDTGSAVLIKQDGAYYLLTASHVCEGQAEGDAVKITSIDGTECVYGGLERAVSPSNGGADVCVMKLPEDVAISIAQEVKCATFEGSGYPCEIDGFPVNARDKKLRIETGCKIAKETEVGDGLYVELEQQRTDGLKMEDVKGGFSGSGVFVDSNGEKYLIGIVYRVEDTRNLFIGWKMQKINEILKGKGWAEIPLIPIELRLQVIEQYNNLIRNSEFVLKRIRTKIIGQVQLPRESYKTQIETAIAENRIVIITGEAGIGKSALAKDVLANPAYKAVAVVGDDLDEDNERSILDHWKISDKLQDLYKSPVWGEGEKVLLVESAERMLNGNTDTAIVFVADLMNDAPDLKVVFTIRKHALNLFRVVLQGNGIYVPEKSVIEVGTLDDEELKQVEDAVPRVKPYMDTDKTREILRNPFYLNQACSIATTQDVSNLKGSEFKDMLCRQIVTGSKHGARMAAQRIQALIEVARRTSAVGMNLVKCEMTEAVTALANDDVLVGDVKTGYLRPGHDILTDWGLYCYIDELYKNVEAGQMTLATFYEHVDKNVAFRNVLKQYVETHIAEDARGLDAFVAESLSLKMEDYFYDDLMYAILVSERGAAFLTSIKHSLLANRGQLLRQMANALSYMFRKVDWEIKEWLTKSSTIGEGRKLRNSDFIVPTGKGWYTFVTFLYENRDTFYAAREVMIPLLLQCELVRLTQEEAPNLKKYVFEILAEDADRLFSDDDFHGKAEKEVIRLLFKWMDENPELVKSWVERAIASDSYKYKEVKEFLLLSEGLEATGFIHTYPELYKALVRKEWLNEEGIVRDYYPMIHQSSGVTTTYKCFFYAHAADAIVFLCELLNYDIEKKKGDRRHQLQEVKVTVDGNEKVLLGDDRLWRDYRGQNYESHVRESLLMTFEKWLMDSINNHNNKAKYALDKDTLLAVFDIVYNRCVNVSAWGVLASVATRFPVFVGMKAMPIYSCRTFIMWDKTRYSTELMRPMISPLASQAVRKEVAASYDLPHRKKDLEGVILRMSMTKGFAEEFRKLVKHLKETASTYMEKVSAGRMDIDQYKIVGKTEEGYLLQGSPSEDIKEEAEEHEVVQNQFNRLMETGNRCRARYDDETHDVAEWRVIYQLHKDQDGMISAKGLVAALGVKKYWDELDRKERKWCKKEVFEETMRYATSRQYQVYSEYSSDGLVHLLDKEPKDKEVIAAVWYLMDAIEENDSIFVRFEGSFKTLIWGRHHDLAKKIVLQYLANGENRRDDVDKFAHVCKLLPTDVENKDINEMAEVYCKQYFGQWTDENINRYAKIWDTRIDTFCAEYMIAKPEKRRKFIEDVWLVSDKGVASWRHGMSENPITSVFSHYCYVATKENREKFWALWEVMFAWYKENKTGAVLPSLMLNFELMRVDLLNDWEVMEGSGEHVNKLLRELTSEGLPYLSRLVCRTGFKSLMPESLRYIDKELLRASAMDRKSLRHWQDAVEDLYDDAKTRDTIKRDKELCTAYVVVLNGLISNGSAIAYMIRDYYV